MKKILSIAAVLAAAVPLGLWKSTPAGAKAAAGWTSRATIAAGHRRTRGHFTGDVSVKPLFDPTQAATSAPPRSRSHRARGPPGTPIPPARR